MATTTMGKRHVTVNWTMRGKTFTKQRVEHILEIAEVWPKLTNAHLADKAGVSGNAINAIMGGLGVYHVLRSDTWWQEIAYKRYQHGSPRTRLWYERIGYVPDVKLLDANGKGYVPNSLDRPIAMSKPVQGVLEPELTEEVEHHRTVPPTPPGSVWLTSAIPEDQQRLLADGEQGQLDGLTMTNDEAGNLKLGWERDEDNQLVPPVPTLPGYIDQEDLMGDEPDADVQATPTDMPGMPKHLWQDDPTDDNTPSHIDMAESQAELDLAPVPQVWTDDQQNGIATSVWSLMRVLGGPEALGLVHTNHLTALRGDLEALKGLMDTAIMRIDAMLPPK